MSSPSPAVRRRASIRRGVNLSLDRLKGHHEIHERPAQNGGNLAIVKTEILAGDES
jgi:hypothetical protein